MLSIIVVAVRTAWASTHIEVLVVHVGVWGVSRGLGNVGACISKKGNLFDSSKFCSIFCFNVCNTLKL